MSRVIQYVHFQYIINMNTHDKSKNIRNFLTERVSYTRSFVTGRRFVENSRLEHAKNEKPSQKSCFKTCVQVERQCYKFVLAIETV